jgi:hypothetical protein
LFSLKLTKEFHKTVPVAIANGTFAWRGKVALALVPVAALSGSISVDSYTAWREYIPPVILVGIAICFAITAVRSKHHADRLLGWPALAVLALLCVYMLVDRISIWMGWSKVY